MVGQLNGRTEMARRVGSESLKFGTSLSGLPLRNLRAQARMKENSGGVFHGDASGVDAE